MSPNFETRTTREEDLLEVYRTTFNRKLREFNYVQEFQLSKELLKEVMRQKAIYGFNMMLTTFPAILRDSDKHSGDSIEMFKDEAEMQRVAREMVQNDLFINYLRFHLKKFHRGGVFDVEY